FDQRLFPDSINKTEDTRLIKADAVLPATELKQEVEPKQTVTPWHPSDKLPGSTYKAPEELPNTRLGDERAIRAELGYPRPILHTEKYHETGLVILSALSQLSSTDRAVFKDTFGIKNLSDKFEPILFVSDFFDPLARSNDEPQSTNWPKDVFDKLRNLS